MSGVSAPGFVDDLHWGDQAIDGEVDNVPEAITQYLNSKDIDLAELDGEGLRKMIADILAKHPEFRNDKLIIELADLAGDWQRDEGLFKTDFGREAVGEHFLLKFAKLMIENGIAPDNEGPLASVVSNEEGIVAAMDVAETLEFGSHHWSSLGNQQSVSDASVFSGNVKMLEGHYDLDAIGLTPMLKEIDQANAKYQKSMGAASSLEGEARSKAEKMAVSTLRIDVAQARIGFLESQQGAAGLTAGDAELVQDIKHERSVIQQEELWQSNLNSTWEYSMLGSQHFSWDPEGLGEQRSYLATQYQQLQARGDTVGAAYVLSRIQSLDAAIGETTRLIDGGASPASPPVLMVGLGLALSFVDSDIALAGSLRDKAIAEGNKELEKEFQTKIDMLTDIRGRVMDFMKALGQGFMSAAVAA